MDPVASCQPWGGRRAPASARRTSLPAPASPGQWPYLGVLAAHFGHPRTHRRAAVDPVSCGSWASCGGAESVRSAAAASAPAPGQPEVKWGEQVPAPPWRPPHPLFAPGSSSF